MIALSNTPVLETERLILRAPQGADWPYFRDFMPTERARFISGGTPAEGKHWRAFGHMIGHWAMRGYGMFVFCEKGSDVPLGATGPWNPAEWPEPEIGWNLWSPAAEGKGYAAEAARAAIRHVFDDLGWDTAVSFIDLRNSRSIALAERLGALRDDAAAVPPADAEGGTIRAWRHPKGSAQ
ncbi:GNAT family N-acetyltransferase [Paracoccus jiaweipingae]|uniref:GNAT family N-acetyltransferase n=1 Tax=unclassified Paracoccus (in: a-proteobacteria) TaxID=2688777 RepID=UPI0037B0E716